MSVTYLLAFQRCHFRVGIGNGGMSLSNTDVMLGIGDMALMGFIAFRA